MRFVDSHIHFDQYSKRERERIVAQLRKQKSGLIAVSTDFQSSQQTMTLQQQYSDVVFSTIGWHPEQRLATDEEKEAMYKWLEHKKFYAVGEVGLPYYTRQQKKLDEARYLEDVTQWIQYASQQSLPVVLHTVYEDAETILPILERYNIQRAQFHWLKAETKIIEQIVSNGYMISVTPEVVYRPKIQKMLPFIPLDQLMVETDGPWPFEGPFTKKRTEPHFVQSSIEYIATTYDMTVNEVSEQLFQTTCDFFQLPETFRKR